MFDFDTPIDRRGTHALKWDMMQPLYGVPADDGIAMWVADMDFRPPAAVTRALRDLVDHGVYGYPGAKLARKALMKQVAVKHPRGLRADGVTI